MSHIFRELGAQSSGLKGSQRIHFINLLMYLFLNLEINVFET